MPELKVPLLRVPSLNVACRREVGRQARSTPRFGRGTPRAARAARAARPTRAPRLLGERLRSRRAPAARDAHFTAHPAAAPHAPAAPLAPHAPHAPHPRAGLRLVYCMARPHSPPACVKPAHGVTALRPCRSTCVPAASACACAHPRRSHPFKPALTVPHPSSRSRSCCRHALRPVCPSVSPAAVR